jgi:3,4-dihydroxy-2-butanone 4-phosphate synthase
MKFSNLEQAIKDLQRGKFVMIVDDETRENEGDLVIAAEKATPSKINFMIKKAGGLICVPMLKERLDQLKLPLVVEDKNNTELTRCKFTVSTDLKNDKTGISAHDRHATIKALIDPNTAPEDLARPGHIFPLRYAEGGVLEREGHTEAAIDICKLAGLYPAAVICEILKEDGDTAKLEDLKEFSKKQNLTLISIEQLLEYIKKSPKNT